MSWQNSNWDGGYGQQPSNEVVKQNIESEAESEAKAIGKNYAKVENRSQNVNVTGGSVGQQGNISQNADPDPTTVADASQTDATNVND